MIKKLIQFSMDLYDIESGATVLESMVRSMSREVQKFYKVKPFWEIAEVVEG